MKQKFILYEPIKQKELENLMEDGWRIVQISSCSGGSISGFYCWLLLEKD